jgi:hypothetical protein
VDSHISRNTHNNFVIGPLHQSPHLAQPLYTQIRRVSGATSGFQVLLVVKQPVLVSTSAGAARTNRRHGTNPGAPTQNPPRRHHHPPRLPGLPIKPPRRRRTPSLCPRHIPHFLPPTPNQTRSSATHSAPSPNRDTWRRRR